MERPVISLDFCDLGARVVKSEHWLFKILQERFEVRLTTSPDFVFYGDCGEVHEMYTCTRIYIGCGEPDFSECDYAVSVGENGRSKMENGKASQLLAIGSTEPNDKEKQRLLSFFEKVFADRSTPVAHKRRLTGRWVLVRKS